MSQTTEDAKPAQPLGLSHETKVEKPVVRFWPYALLGSFLLVVFVAGILASDYFNYRIRMAKIQAFSMSGTTNAPGVSAAGLTNLPGVTSNAAPATSASKPSSENLAAGSLELKGSELFETYAKLLTMLLGFVSVLGVFFGYFVRKSLREVEEDLRGHVALSMDLWAKEKDRLSGEVAAKLKEISKHQQQQAKLVAEFEKTLDRSKQALQALEAAAKSEEQKLTGGAGRTASAAATIDADNSIPQPQGE